MMIFSTILMGFLVLLIHTVENNGAEWHKFFAKSLPDMKVSVFTETFDRAVIEEVEWLAIWGTPPALLRHAKNIKAIFTLSAGVEHIMKEPFFAPHPVYRIEDGGMGIQMYEYVLYAALALQRDFDIYHREMRENKWNSLDFRAAEDFHIGFMGAGVLSRFVLQRLLPHGYPLSCWHRGASSPAKMQDITVFSGHSSLKAFLSSLDLVIALLPHTEETTDLLNSETLSWLPQGASLVNLGRGNLVDETALIRALDSGHLRHAFLDVFKQEPLEKNHPLRSHPKASLTPHIAARTLIPQACKQIAGKIKQIQQGQTPSGLVDRARSY